MDFSEIWLQFKEVFGYFVQYGVPAVALVFAFLSYKDSRKANKIQSRLIEVEEKLKKYELEEKEKQREEATQACVEARVVNISKGKYRLKVWNSGRATAYNVDFNIPEEYKVMVRREKVPYEFLESGKSFEEHVIVYSGTPSKFTVTTVWNDKQGNSYSKEQIATF
jgi:hypothetical protein